MKQANLKRTLLGFALISLLLTALTGCVVYDDPYPHYYNHDRYYSRPYYYRPYSYSYSYRGHWD